MKITEEGIERIRPGHIESISTSILVNDRFKVSRIDFMLYTVRGFEYGELQEPVFKGNPKQVADWLNEYFGTKYID